MPELIQFRDGDVLVAVRTADDASQPGVADKPRVLDRSFAGALKLCRRIGDEFATQIDGMTRVEGAELEVGFQFTPRGDLYIVEADGQAALKVKFTFKR